MAKIKELAKKCHKCRKRFEMRLDIIQPFTVGSGIVTSIFVFLLGYVVAIDKWPIMSLLIILLITTLIPVFWKKKRKIILQRYIIVVPALLLGFILGMSGFEISSKNDFIVYAIFLIWTYASYLGVVSLQRTAKYKLKDNLSRIVGYIMGVIYLPLGIVMIWVNIYHSFTNNSFSLFPGIFGLAFITLGIFAVYYASKIRKLK